MKKDVVKEAVRELGIHDGDIIKIIRMFGNDYYKYNEGKFIVIGDKTGTLTEDEIFDLLAGKLEFENISGTNRKKLEEISNEVDKFNQNQSSMIVDIAKNNATQANLNERVYNIEKEIALKKKQDKEAGIIGLCVYGALAVLFLIFTFIRF